MSSETLAEKPSVKRKRTVAKSRAVVASMIPRYLELPLPNESPYFPDTRSTDYRTISEKKVYGKFYFNAQHRDCLRDITVSGVKLVWNRDSDPALRELNNKKDLRRVTIVADSIHISTPLRFPQSEVIIFARQLIFSGKGSINISPEANLNKPKQKKITTGTGQYRGEDGLDGCNAGSIILNVKTLGIPDSTQEKPTVRLIAHGADGQPGGDGGLVDEALGQTPPPARITWQMVSNRFFNTPFCLIPFGIPITFGMGNWIAKLTQWKSQEMVFPDYWKQHFDTHHVVQADMSVTLPKGFYLRHWSTSFGKKQKPLNGSDAYPSGQPGHGGNGGIVVLNGKLAYVSSHSSNDSLTTPLSDIPCKVSFDDLVSITGGKAGISQKINGQQPALKIPASYVKMVVRMDGSGPMEFYPEYVTPKKGKDAAAPKANKGAPGVTNLINDQPSPFIHEYNAEAMLNYAKDACIGHNRDLAHQVVEMYLEAIGDVAEMSTNRLAALKSEFNSLKDRLDTDVDVFGHQLGWVPQLSVVATKNLFDSTVKNAFNSMYLCQKMKNRWETMADNLACIKATRNDAAKQLEDAQNDLRKAQDDYLDLQEDFNDICGDIGTMQAELSSLNNEIAQWAELNEKNKALYAGIAETVGGAVQLLGAGIQMIPVGQPATGLIGSAIQVGGGTGGKIVSSLIEGGNLFDAGSELSEQASQFIEKNKADISNAVVKTCYGKLDKDLKSAQGAFNKAGNETQALTRDKELLQALVMMPTRKLPDGITKEDYQKFKKMHKALAELNAGTKDVEMVDISYEENQKIAPHTEEMEAYLNQEQYISVINKLRKSPKKAEQLAANLKSCTKSKQKKVDNVQTVLGGMAKMNGGIQQGLGGIRKMCMRKEDLEPKIQAQIAKLKGTVYADRFEDLAQKLAILNNTKEEFARRFELSSIAVDNAMSRINGSMAQMDVIDDHALGISGVLDHSLFSTLVSLDKEARAMLVEQLYYFAKAYEYRFLRKVDPRFYTLDKFIKKLEKFLATDESGTKVGLSKEEYQDMYSMLTDQLRQLVVRPLIKDLQEKGPLLKKTYEISANRLLSDHTFQRLNTPDTDGYYKPVQFNLVDCQYGSPNTRKLRIVSLDLKSVELADKEKAKQTKPTFDMEFIHNGVSEVFDGKQRYIFRTQSDDEKNSWKFTCNVDKQGDCKVKPYKKVTRDVKLLKQLCDSDKDVDQLMESYRPGAYADITLLRKKAGLGEPSKIADFVVEVVLEGRF